MKQFVLLACCLPLEMTEAQTFPTGIDMSFGFGEYSTEATTSDFSPEPVYERDSFGAEWMVDIFNWTSLPDENGCVTIFGIQGLKFVCEN